MSVFDVFHVNKKKNTNQYLSGFSKTNQSIGYKIKKLLNNKIENKESFLEQLMITFIESDLGYQTATLICDNLSKKYTNFDKLSKNDLLDAIVSILKDIYNQNEDSAIVYNENSTTVILMVGVNGSGKTSTCAKLANYYMKQGKKVALVAADTFRAGAIAQLQTWATRLEIPCIIGKEKQDPSSVLVDGCKFAKENNIDILLCDTAGRLQNKVNLMNELEKMFHVVNKYIEGAPHNTFLVVDANTGQNGLSQAELFNESCKLNGVILTKMDGTSKGGIVLSIKNRTNVPVRYITFGEGIEDIEDFDLDLYLYSIIGELQDES